MALLRVSCAGTAFLSALDEIPEMLRLQTDTQGHKSSKGGGGWVLGAEIVNKSDQNCSAPGSISNAPRLCAFFFVPL